MLEEILEQEQVLDVGDYELARFEREQLGSKDVSLEAEVLKVGPYDEECRLAEKPPRPFQT